MRTLKKPDGMPQWFFAHLSEAIQELISRIQIAESKNQALELDLRNFSAATSPSSIDASAIALGSTTLVDIDTGLIRAEALGSGTVDGSTVLFSDGTWGSASGGGLTAAQAGARAMGKL